MDRLIGKSVIVSGKVQGVFYRASTVEECNRLGLTGWVKNLPGNEVQIEVFGPEPAVDKLVAWCKQGPPMARVENVSTERIPYKEEALFKVRY